jgi:hypothetical protein
MVPAIPSLRKIAVWAVVGICTFLLLALAASQIEQRLLRKRAERLLADLDSIELRKTPWDGVQRESQRWGGIRTYNPQCNTQKCTLEITLNDFVFDHCYTAAWPSRIDDYLRYRLKLASESHPLVNLLAGLTHTSLYFGVRPAQIIARVEMRDGIVWGKGFSSTIQFLSPSYSADGRRYDYVLIASAHSVPRFPVRDYGILADPVRLHPNYAIGRPGGCTGCVAVWADFTPYADTADVHRLMQLDLSCLTRWHPCTTQQDIMPVAWAEFEAERPRIQALRNPNC